MTNWDQSITSDGAAFGRTPFVISCDFMILALSHHLNSNENKETDPRSILTLRRVRSLAVLHTLNLLELAWARSKPHSCSVRGSPPTPRNQRLGCNPNAHSPNPSVSIVSSQLLSECVSVCPSLYRTNVDSRVISSSSPSDLAVYLP
jgi:hypothetical protein